MMTSDVRPVNGTRDKESADDHRPQGSWFGLAKFRRQAPPQSESDHTRVRIPFLDCGPEIVVALSTGSSAFQDLTLAFFFGREPIDGVAAPLAISIDDRKKLRENFHILVDNFEADHGSLVRSYFASHCMAAAALTSKDEIEVVLARDIPSSELIQVIRRAQSLGYQSWHRLEKYDRKLCQRMIFSVVLEVLRRLDRTRESANGTAHDSRSVKEMTPAELAYLRRNLDEAEEFMLRCSSRRAQSQYIRGMLRLGSLFVVPAVLAAAVVGAVQGSYTGLLGQALLVWVAGAVGAVVSVMWRMTSGTFSINLPTLGHESGDSQLNLMGAVRPLIGGVFALAVFVFAKSPLIPLDTADKGDTFLFVGLGFLAGFSERFAQDMFVRSGQGLAGPGGDAPSTGLSAGLAPPPGARGRSRHRESAGAATG
jgi:hypothetical protein